MTGISERVNAPIAGSATTAAAAAAVARRMPDDAGAPSPQSDAEGGARPTTPHARYASGAPDPSGRSGSLLDVFA